MREGESHFSFAYPTNFENILIDTGETYTLVSFQRSMLEEKYVDSWIDISIGGPSPKYGIIDAKSSIEYHITNLKKQDNFQLLERSSITVASVKAEKVIYSFTNYPLWEQVDEEKDLKESSIIIDWVIIFDYGGLIWEIKMGSIEKVAESDEEIFDHLIKSFRILD